MTQSKHREWWNKIIWLNCVFLYPIYSLVMFIFMMVFLVESCLVGQIRMCTRVFWDLFIMFIWLDVRMYFMNQNWDMFMRFIWWALMMPWVLRTNLYFWVAYHKTEFNYYGFHGMLHNYDLSFGKVVLELSFCMMLSDRNPFELLSWKDDLGDQLQDSMQSCDLLESTQLKIKASVHKEAFVVLISLDKM